MVNAYHEKKLFLDPDVPYSFRTYTPIITGSHTIVEPHYHEFIELIYCQKGTLELLLDGSKYILYPGDLVLIHSMTMHAIRSLGSLCNQHIAILFQPDLLYNTSHSPFEMKYVLPFTTRSTQNQFLFKCFEIENTPIVHLLESIVKEERDKVYGFELAIRTHIGSIGLWLLRHWNEKGMHLDIVDTLRPETIHRLKLVLDYVDQNYTQEICLEDMATLCNVTYSYFSRFFKTHMNKNFKDYVNLIRVRKSEDLLVSTNNSITDIGTSVGFTTTSYFIKRFKLYKNMTPKEYRDLWLDKK